MHSWRDNLADSAKNFDSVKLLSLGSSLDSDSHATPPSVEKLANLLGSSLSPLPNAAQTLLGEGDPSLSFLADTQEHTRFFEARNHMDTLLDSICKNQDMWRKYGSTGGSLWMRFLSHSMRSLISDASFISDFDCTHSHMREMQGETNHSTHVIVSRPILQGEQNNPNLPVLCMADDRSIIPMVCEALNTHKLAGQYDFPVVGLLCPRSSNQCHVILGWLSKPLCLRSQEQMTDAYIAIPEYHTTHEPRGIFDLTTPNGARAFTLFLVQCGICLASAKTFPHIQRGIALASSGQPLLRCASVEDWQKCLDRHDFPLMDPVDAASEHRFEQQQALASIKWKSEPNACLMEKLIWPDDSGSRQIFADLDPDLDDQSPPGIFEWSLDSYVFTLPFISQGYTYTRYQRQLDVLHLLVLGHEPLAETSMVSGPALRPQATLDSGRTFTTDHTVFDLSLHCESIEALVILVHEMGLLCCSQGGHACWETLWHETAHCLLAMTRTQRSAVGKEPYISFNRFGCINVSRCTEYDQRVVSHRVLVQDYSESQRESLEPYETIVGKLQTYKRLLGSDDNPIWWSTVGSGLDGDEKKQIERAAQHAIRLMGAIIRDQTSFAGWSSPNLKLELRKDHVDSIKELYKWRIDHYPLEDVVDASMTVVIEDFLETHVSSTQDLQDDFLFFKHSEGGSADIRFHLPVLLVKHQEDKNKLQIATSNMQRMDCISAVRFLAALGIKDFPVYGLSTYGSCGLLCQAWFSEADNCCYIVDQIPAKYRFDISNEEDLVRYITFLGKMKAHAEELRSRFENVRKSLVGKLSTSEGRQSLKWTLHAQIKEYQL